MWKIGTFLFAGLFIISLFTGGFGLGANQESAGKAGITGNAVQQAKPTIPTGVALVSAKELEDDDPFIGDENAPVTMVEFSDFQCPFCGRFRSQTFDQIKAKYIDTGKVKFVYRDFPLESIHPQARPSAEAAECADEQGKFWEYHDKLFEEQQVWASAGSTEFKKYATDLGLDTKQFNTCLESGKYKDEVSNDLADATRAGGQGTPHFVIGKTPISGAQPFSSFEAAIEAELKK